MAKKMDSRKKTKIIIGVVIAALAVIAGIKLTSTNAPKNVEETNNSNISSTAEGVDILPGTSDRKSYNELQQLENEKNAQAALDNQKSNLPVLINNNKDDKNDPFNDLNLNVTQPKIKEETPVIDTTPPEVPAPVVQAPPVAQPQVEPVQMQPVAAYDAGERSTQRDKVQRQLEGYLAKWGASEAFQERDMTGEDIDKFEKANGSSGLSGNGVNGQLTSSNSSQVSIVRAGTVIPAVMITALNSDTPGPVMAEIVSGELKGARLLGEMRANNQHIVVQFTTLSQKGHPKSYAINAVAIDPNTTSSALASNVDNHYFLRYGLGLAAEFISGYGEAVQNKGTTTTIGPMGNVTQTKGDLNHSEIAESAFGKVGQKLAREIEKDTNRRPTVTVDSGVPLGILFLSNF